jgi:serine/threonine-protein kinase
MLPQYRTDPLYNKMLLDEANLGVVLDHHHIVRVIDAGVEAGAFYLAMEYVDGGSLRSLSSNAKELGIAFPEQAAASIMRQVAEALDYIHTKRDADGQGMNLVHRDICPSNILIKKGGAAKVTDFGIARTKDQGSSQGSETAVQGKLLYMSPEQALGSPTDHRSDIYSAGLVLFELLAGEPCFVADEQLGLLEKVRGGMVRDIREARPDVSKPMVRILDKMLEKSLSARYRSAQSLAHDLTAYLSHTGASSLDSDVGAFLRLLDSALPQTKAFASSRFYPVKGNFALPSEREKERPHDDDANEVKAKKRPAWVLQVLNALLILLAYLLWVSMNAL